MTYLGRDRPDRQQCHNCKSLGHGRGANRGYTEGVTQLIMYDKNQMVVAGRFTVITVTTHIHKHNLSRIRCSCVVTVAAADICDKIISEIYVSNLGVLGMAQLSIDIQQTSAMFSGYDSFYVSLSL